MKSVVRIRSLMVLLAAAGLLMACASTSTVSDPKLSETSAEETMPVVTAASLPQDYTPAVLITGGNRGLGLEFTRQYAALGWTVISTARNPDEAEELQALAAEYSNISIEALDVNDFEQVDALAAKYQDQPVDVLLNNAGLSGSPSPKQLFGRLDYSLFDSYMHTNARGPLKMCETFLPNVKASKMKRMVTVSSLGGSF